MSTRCTTLFTLLLLSVFSCARADTTVKRLAPGITLTQEIDKKTPLIINVLSVDLNAPGVRIGVGIGQDRISGVDATKGREDVSRYARRHGVLAAVNGDFFPFTGDPLGIGIKDGELFSEPWPGKTLGQSRVGLGVGSDGRSVLIDTLGFLGDLQAADGARYFLSGINRTVGPGEIVAFTSLYGPTADFRSGGTQMVLESVNLPVRANKLIVGHIRSVQATATLSVPIPTDGLVLSAGPGAGAAFLSQHCHPGDTLGFVLAVTPDGQTHDGVKIAALPRTDRDLPSRDGGSVARGAYAWANISQAIGGGPRLLYEGQVAIDGAHEGFDVGFTDHAYPRTAVGVSRDGQHLIVVTVDGRQTYSRGVTLGELAAILKRYGAWDAMNFDGGGSTAMAVAGLTINSPEGSGSERPVADMLTISTDTPYLAYPAGAPADATASFPVLLPPAMPLYPGAVVPLIFQGKTISAAGTERNISIGGSSPHLLWQGLVTNGIGFVNQKGYFIAQKPGTGVVTALNDGQLLTGTLTVLSKTTPLSTFALRADLSADPTGAPNRSVCVIRILDKTNTPKAGASIQITVTGGAADADTLTTNIDGSATVGITWNSDRGGSVLVLSPGLPSVTLLQTKQTL